jgi:carboxylesterase type B
MIDGVFSMHAQEIKERYMKEYGSFAAAFDGFFSDSIFHFPMHMYAEQMSAQGAKVYRYRFEHPLESSVPLKLRVHHASEIPFVFHQNELLTPQEIKQAERMVKHWTSFATDGNPGEGFPAYSDGKKVLVYGVDGEKIETEQWRKGAMDFWSRVFGEMMAAGAAAAQKA